METWIKWLNVYLPLQATFGATMSDDVFLPSWFEIKLCGQSQCADCQAYATDQALVAFTCSTLEIIYDIRCRAVGYGLLQNGVTGQIQKPLGQSFPTPSQH